MNKLQKTIIRLLGLDAWVYNSWIKSQREQLNDLNDFKEKLEHGESVLNDCKKVSGDVGIRLCKHSRMYINEVPGRIEFNTKE